MSQPTASDVWYIRLPDGRILRANNTRAVRHHLIKGRVPLESRVRRSADEEWAGLEWTQEFADLVREQLAAEHTLPDEPSSLDFPATLRAHNEPGGIAARLDPMRLQTVGLRGLFDEMLGALDNTLVRGKMLVAAAAGILAALAVLVAELAEGLAPVSQRVGFAALAVLLIAALADCLLTQMSYVELCKLRPARWTETRAGLGRNVILVALAYLVVVGGALLAIYGLRLLPGWLAQDSPWPAQEVVREPLAGAVAALALLLEVVLWAVAVLALLLGPILIIEEGGLFTALRQWGQLLRRHLARAVLYEALALLPAVVATYALFALVDFAARGQIANHPSSATNPMSSLWVLPMQRLLQGLAVSPLLAYLAVANVFIYLNLRYEQEPRRKG
jgi:hypothetical protein